MLLISSTLFGKGRKSQSNSYLLWVNQKKVGPGWATIASISQMNTIQRVFFSPAQPGTDWHSDFVASRCGREVFCSHHSPTGVCYWQHFLLTLAENKNVPLHNISLPPPTPVPLSHIASVLHPMNMCNWHQASMPSIAESSQWPPLNMQGCSDNKHIVLLWFSEALAQPAFCSWKAMLACSLLAHRSPTSDSGTQNWDLDRRELKLMRPWCSKNVYLLLALHRWLRVFQSSVYNKIWLLSMGQRQFITEIKD